jgi:hypothetical protein
MLTPPVHLQVLLTLPPNITQPMKLQDLHEQCSPLLVDYIVGSIDLAASLCMGRCAAVIQTVQKVLPLPLILAALRLPGLIPELQSAFVNLLLQSYVDVDPQKVRPAVSYTRVWLHLEKPMANYKPSEDFVSVKKQCQFFLENQCSEEDLDRLPGFALLLSRMLELVLRMFEFGEPPLLRPCSCLPLTLQSR